DQLRRQVLGRPQLREPLQVVLQAAGPAALPAVFQVDPNEGVQGEGAQRVAAGHQEAVEIKGLATALGLLPEPLKALGHVPEQLRAVVGRVADGSIASGNARAWGFAGGGPLSTASGALASTIRMLLPPPVAWRGLAEPRLPDALTPGSPS